LKLKKIQSYFIPEKMSETGGSSKSTEGKEGSTGPLGGTLLNIPKSERRLKKEAEEADSKTMKYILAGVAALAVLYVLSRRGGGKQTVFMPQSPPPIR
jgi:hypothetical protein